MKSGFLFLLSFLRLDYAAAMIRSRNSFLRVQGERFLGTFSSYKKNKNFSSPRYAADESKTVVIPEPKEISKRKVALTLAYVGSNYHGLQMDMGSSVPTVEAEVESALFKMGCITEANHLDLAKISWSRSSRTDKHVHCARVVISTKLEIPQKWFTEDAARIFPLVKEINRLLPPDIRLISACKINSSFKSKEACSWREYEYVIPKSMLLSSTDDAECSDPKVRNTEAEVIAVFVANLKRYEGNRSFHNFHRVSKKNLQPRRFDSEDGTKSNTRKREFPLVPTADKLEPSSEVEDKSQDSNSEKDSLPALKDSEVEHILDADSKAESESPEDAPTEQSTEQAYIVNFFDNWVPELRIQNDATRGTVFACEIIEEDGEGVLGNDFIRLRIRGQSFLLHQIRLMVAAAVLVTRGILPDTAMDMALLSPYFINLPLAPAEGLILVNAGFERNSNGQMVYIFNENHLEPSKEDPYSLMTKSEFEASKQFKTDLIYPRIKQDWCLNDSDLVSKWLLFAEKYRPSKETVSNWEPILAQSITTAAQDREMSAIMVTKRVQRNIERFRFEYMRPLGPDGKKAFPKNNFDGVSHGKLLPNGIATLLVTRFRVMPGSEVTSVLRALATMFVTGELNAEMTAEDLCDYVTNNGGFSHFVTNMPTIREII